MKKVLFSLVCVAMSLTMLGQDVHSSQPSLGAVRFNPAMSGMFQGNWRVAGRYRAQWLTVPVNYRTINIEADAKVLQLGSSQLSLGTQLMHDLAGDGALSWAQGGLSGALARPLSEYLTMSAGVSLQVAQRNVDYSGLKFKNQWNGDVFDPSAPNKEPLGRKTGMIPQVGAGLGFRFANAEQNRTSIEGGLAAHQINRPVVSFQDDKESRTAVRWTSQAQGVFQIAPSLDLVAFTQLAIQGPYRELTGGLGARTIIGSNGNFLTALHSVVAYRAGDAVIPTVQIDYGPWNIGISYDLNISPFRDATNRHGGWELAFVYRSVPVPPVPEFKACPVF